MGLKKFVILIAIISWPLNLFALTDKELRESKKCSGLFNYFEKKYNLPKDLLHSIALQESAKRHTEYKINIVWPWTVNVNGTGYHFPTKKEAVRFTKLKLAEGNDSIDVGCMQINLKYHPEAFISVEQAFTPIKNVGYGAKFLREKFDVNGDWMHAIGNYHSQTKDKSLNYSNSVSRIALNMDNYKDLLKSYTAKSSRSTKAIEDYYNRYKSKPSTSTYQNTRMKPPARGDYYRTNITPNKNTKRLKANNKSQIKHKTIANR